MFNSCFPNCNGKICGNDGCKGNCGTCPSEQTCGQDGKCSRTGCISNCDGKNCGDDDNCGKPCQEGICPSGQTCISGKCNPNTPATCYQKDQDPFGNPPGACSQNRLKCCDDLQFCFNSKTNSYVCRDKTKTVVGDICKDFKYPDCTKIPNCKGSNQFCPS